MRSRVVPSGEIASCPKGRLDANHYIPSHKTDECGAKQKRKKKENKTVTITVMGGVVTDVENLPEGWSYRLIDHDI